MILSDHSIRRAMDTGLIVIDPFQETCVQAASYDVHLGSILVPYGMNPRQSMDNDTYDLMPGDFVLAGLHEHVRIYAGIAAKIDGISSLGRQGITIHATSGFVDPGWSGVLTLEVSNISKSSFRLVKGMRIAQLVFYWLDRPAEVPYRGRYYGAGGPESAKEI